jgi:mono/diheme cytochrome c family protein
MISKFFAPALAVVASLALHGTAAAETPLERVAYLMTSIVACGNCHTPKGPTGDVPGMELTGMAPFEKNFGI